MISKEELFSKFSDILTKDDQAERSTLLDDVRAEVANLYDEIETANATVTDLTDKNKKLVEANSDLFTRISYKKEDPEDPTNKPEKDYSKLFKEER